MDERWTVGSVNGTTKTGQEGEWKSVEQIQGQQTLLIDNVFGISMRAIKVSGGKYIDPQKATTLSSEKLDDNNNSIEYALSEISENYSNPYYIMMEEAGLDVRGAVKKIKEQLNNGRWTYENVDGLREYGVVIGIITKLERKDAANGFKTNFAREFREDPVIELMRSIEWKELELSKYAPEERLRLASERAQDDSFNSFSYIAKKYEKMQKREQEGALSKQADMLEAFMKEKGIGVEALRYLFVRTMGSRERITDVEQHLVEEKGEFDRTEIVQEEGR